VPRENQVFFFQGAGPKVKSNAIKSVLTIHDNRRLPPLRQGETIKMRNEREVIGGSQVLLTIYHLLILIRRRLHFVIQMVWVK